ncbi:response regulator [Geothrix alkalitolerans]|uniref:response regulator n=1 Tax=Geothrix alkalitolerans TaxID=2922724 RepID=UPI001FAFADD7|nr:response regulator [Geothrix alkalitolerans]
MNPAAHSRLRPDLDAPGRTLLVVEDDRATLSLYRAGLKGLQGFRILAASNGQEALEVLRQEAVHVLVTDLDMPVMDGFNLITKVGRLYPQIPVIVMTGLDEGQHLNTPLDLGAVRILSKPLRLGHLMEVIRTAVQAEPVGVIRGLTLGSILQLLAWEQKSCTLTVRSQAGMGLLYLKRGEVIHAAYRDQSGFPAVYEILTWDRPDIEFVETCRVERTIDTPLTELLLNVALISDSLGPEGDPDPSAGRAGI